MIPPKDEWVTVGRTPLEVVAEMMRARLEADGIDAVLRGNRASNTAGAVNELNLSWDNPLGGVEVRVHKDDEARAREILAESDDEEVPHRPRSWLQTGLQLYAAWMFAAMFGYGVIGLTANATLGILVGILAFGAIFVVGNRRL